MGHATCGGILCKRVPLWKVCLVFGFVVALLHSTRSQIPPESKFRGGFGRTNVTPREALIRTSRHGTQNPMAELATRSKKSDDMHPRVAICLVGDAGAFELTAHSIKQHVLDIYNGSDVFLHAPFDRDAHKFTLLSDASYLAMARIFENDHVAETPAALEVLSTDFSPNGTQDLMQQFRLVEGCLTMIYEYETKHNFKYDWIVRTQVDSYWSGPLPALDLLYYGYYHVPYGSSFGGINTRLGIGTRNTSWAALSRLSLIPKLQEHGYRNLNSEAAFEHQLLVSNIMPELHGFSFCVLTSRKYVWPPGRWGVPVASIWSEGPLNGVKCKPCKAVVSGEAATQVLNELDPGWGWIPPVSSLQLCDAGRDLEPGWESMFDEVSGPEVAQVRQNIAHRTEEHCVDEVRQFGKLWEDWDAPAPEKLCAGLHREGSATVI